MVVWEPSSRRRYSWAASDVYRKRLQALIGRLELAGKRLAIEVNGRIVTRSAHASHQVQPGDSIEIVQAIGGG